MRILHKIKRFSHVKVTLPKITSELLWFTCGACDGQVITTAFRTLLKASFSWPSKLPLKDRDPRCYSKWGARVSYARKTALFPSFFGTKRVDAFLKENLKKDFGTVLSNSPFFSGALPRHSGTSAALFQGRWLKAPLLDTFLAWLRQYWTRPSKTTKPKAHQVMALTFQGKRVLKTPTLHKMQVMESSALTARCPRHSF